MLLKIRHSATYSYDRPVQYALQQARLTPKSRSYQTVNNWNFILDGATRQLEFDDEHSNRVTLLSIDEGRSDFTVTCEGEVTTFDNAGIIGMHSGYAPLWHFKRSTELTKPGPLIRALVKQLGSGFGTDVQRFHALSNLIAQQVTYAVGSTDISTTAEAVLAARLGVCQDHAHVFISCARVLGYPARYVSGYLMMNDRIDQDATHAWAEVFFEDIGWVGFDVSNRISPDERYVKMATGLDYKEAAPVSGIRLGSSAETMIVSIQVQQ